MLDLIIELLGVVGGTPRVGDRPVLLHVPGEQGLVVKASLIPGVDGGI